MPFKSFFSKQRMLRHLPSVAIRPNKTKLPEPPKPLVFPVGPSGGAAGRAHDEST